MSSEHGNSPNRGRQIGWVRTSLLAFVFACLVLTPFPSGAMRSVLNPVSASDPNASERRADTIVEKSVSDRSVVLIDTDKPRRIEGECLVSFSVRRNPGYKPKPTKLIGKDGTITEFPRTVPVIRSPFFIVKLTLRHASKEPIELISQHVILPLDLFESDDYRIREEFSIGIVPDGYSIIEVSIPILRASSLRKINAD